jgi:hypothetical protein
MSVRVMNRSLSLRHGSLSLVKRENPEQTKGDTPMKITNGTSMTAFTTPTVHVVGYGYRVNINQRWHYVHQDKTCDCGDSFCLAVEAVSNYLREGGERAPEVPYGYTLHKPECCPICHSPTLLCTKLSSPRRGVGWECAVGGKSCYWEHQGNLMAKRVRADKLSGTFRPLDETWRHPPMGYLPSANKCYVRISNEPPMNFILPSIDEIERALGKERQ